MAGNGSWVGFGGCVWWQEQLQGEARVYSGVGGTAAGVVCFDPSGSSSSAIALLRWSASPTVGKFLEIILSALQASQVRNSLLASLVTNNNLVSFKGLPRRGSAGESQDHGTKGLYSIVVCGMHVHCYGDQVIFAYSKVSYHFAS